VSAQQSGANGAAPAAGAVAVAAGRAAVRTLGGRPSDAAPRMTRTQQVLRNTVRRYSACLGQLPHLERRVLVLRAALSRDRVRSRVRVAHITGVPVRRVARAERSGLHQLRALGRRGGCAVAPTPAMTAATEAVAMTEPTLTAGMPGRQPRIEVKSEHRSGTAHRSEAAPTLAAPQSAVVVPPEASDPAGKGGTPIWLVLVPILLLLGYIGWVVRGEVRGPGEEA
jgi:hypothetical protein